MLGSRIAVALEAGIAVGPMVGIMFILGSIIQGRISGSTPQGRIDDARMSGLHSTKA